MNPLKYAQMMKYLTRAKKTNPDLPDVFPASKAPIPAKTQTVQEMEAINEFVKRNPQADGGRIGFKKGSNEKFLVKTGSPKKLENVIEQKFIEVIGSKNRPETYKETGVKKTLYKPQIVVKNKTVLTSDFGSKADATDAVKKYREKNPIKNAPPDLETLDKRKKKKYLDKKERQADIKARGGVPEGGIFSGDPEVHKGHAGNIKGSQTITGDKIIYTPAKINQAMAGTEGKNRFTDLDYKINEAEKKINKIKKSNNSNVEKKKLLKIEDDKLIKYAAQSDGYKVVKLSDGSEFRLPGKSLQSLDPFDVFPGMSEKDISKTINKYKNMKVTKNTSPKDIEMIKKVGVFLENVKLAKSNVPKNTGIKLKATIPVIENIMNVAKSIPGDIAKKSYFKAAGKAAGLAFTPIMLYDTYKALEQGKPLLESLEQGLIGTDLIGGTKRIVSLTPEERTARSVVKQDALKDLNLNMPMGFGFIEGPTPDSNLTLEQAKAKMDAGEQRVKDLQAQKNFDRATNRANFFGNMKDRILGAPQQLQFNSGGIASGPPPKRGPLPQGLPGLLKRGMKI